MSLSSQNENKHREFKLPPFCRAVVSIANLIGTSPSRVETIRAWVKPAHSFCRGVPIPLFPIYHRQICLCVQKRRYTTVSISENMRSVNSKRNNPNPKPDLITPHPHPLNLTPTPSPHPRNRHVEQKISCYNKSLIVARVKFEPESSSSHESSSSQVKFSFFF